MKIESTTRIASLFLLFAFFVCLAASPAVAQNKSPALLTVKGTTMGVIEYTVKAYGDPDLQTELDDAVSEELEAVNQRMSTYIGDSDVSSFNASFSTDWYPVTRETALVVHRAQEISKASGGAFDITVQPLVANWKSYQELGITPPDDDVVESLEIVGYQKLEVKLDPPSIRKSISELQIDLSAIAKGYSVDQVYSRLVELGFEDFLIEVGGEVRASGEKPDKTAWRVGIEKPVENQRVPQQVVELYHVALASSGDYRSFFEIEGKHFSHTIDPRTGRPVEDGIAAASVLAADCITADALATAIMVLGKEEGLKLAETMGARALVMERVGNEIVASGTANFPPDSGFSGIKQPPTEAEDSIFRVIAIACLFFLAAIIAMAIGVIFGRDRIKGSCGGIAALDNPDVAPECSLCSRAAECDDLKKAIRKRTDS